MSCRSSGGRSFQTLGPAAEKLLSPNLDFPRVKLASYGGRSFAYAGPSNWNSLPAYLRDAVVFLFHLLSAWDPTIGPLAGPAALSDRTVRRMNTNK